MTPGIPINPIGLTIKSMMVSPNIAHQNSERLALPLNVMIPLKALLQASVKLICGCAIIINKLRIIPSCKLLQILFLGGIHYQK